MKLPIAKLSSAHERGRITRPSSQWTQPERASPFDTHYDFAGLSRILTIDTNTYNPTPQEVYGRGSIKLRLGNGGAGPTGILKALAEDYLHSRKADFAIAWHQNISHHNLQGLRKGDIDIALTYEREQERSAITEGFAVHHSLVFHDRFILVGPSHNPAGIEEEDTIEVAFQKIAETARRTPQMKLFLSRNDLSATNVRERKIWCNIGEEPWLGEQDWYYKCSVFPQAALQEADIVGCYVLSDFATWMKTQHTLSSSQLMVAGGELLLNSCYALLQQKPSPLALDFLDYLKGPRGQTIIQGFAVESSGVPIYMKASDLQSAVDKSKRVRDTRRGTKTSSKGTVLFSVNGPLMQPMNCK
ncbi:hypothetical protein PROFUN_14583 [Planoprotostelium fungivorum]|uniref:PBP domain-containing protein n=1 Tax=Planoprotostelium fungivorum TaxID=1890364 RepID=A0A2P6MZL9_9EUKA|nr:hypothetical protein PROFUN_14583 [Planoprotostelium fungivorum]